MIYKMLLRKDRFLGAEITFTPIELLTVKDALRNYIKVKDIHPKDRIIAQLVLNEIKLAEDEQRNK